MHIWSAKRLDLINTKADRLEDETRVIMINLTVSIVESILDSIAMY